MSDRLAQSLNELAEANAAGLLNDDEYRILRQSTFDRYATGVDSFPEVSRSVPTKPQRAPVSRPAQGSQPSPKKPRISGLFRRLVSLQRSPSESSLPALRQVLSPVTSSPTKTGSNSRQRASPSPLNSEDEEEETSHSLRQTIAHLEAECNHLLDAFHDLEGKAKCRYQCSNAVLWPAESLEAVSYHHLPTHNGNRSPSLNRARDSIDDLSLRSTRSSSTTTSKSSQLSATTTILSSRSSSIRHVSPSAFSLAPTSSPKRSKSQGNLPLGVLMEVGEADEDERLADELADIQRRRDMVISRYRQRREYLKAKLKAAELREKLLRH